MRYSQFPIARRHFSSVYSYSDYCEANPYRDGGWGYGKDRLANGIRMLREGDTQLVAAAEQFMAQVSAKLPSLAPVTVWDVSGDYVDVPAYLSGEPECMTYEESDDDPSAPIRIWVNVLPSGGISSAQLSKHGAVISALAMVLQQARSNVKVTAYADLAWNARKQGAVVSWDLPTSPLVLSALTASLAQPDIARATTVHACRTLNPGIGQEGDWLRGHCPNYAYDDAWVREDLGAAPDDVVVPGLHLHSPHLVDPLRWVNDQIDRILHGRNQGEAGGSVDAAGGTE